MATFIDLDSVWRDRELYQNPGKYEYTPGQISTWFSAAKNIGAFPKNPSLKPVDFVSTVNLMNLTLPYNDIVASLPRVYVDVHFADFKDLNLIYSADSRHADAKFVCIPDKIQTDDSGDKIWIHFKCTMQQTMRVKRNSVISFALFTRDGTVLEFPDNSPPDPPDPFQQTMCTLEIVPYGRDADYNDNLNDYQSQ